MRQKITANNTFHATYSHVFARKISSHVWDLTPRQASELRDRLCGLSDCRCGLATFTRFFDGAGERLYLEPGGQGHYQLRKAW